MPPVQQQSRINVQDLKAQMVTRVGPERANQYFNHFKGFISLRFSKTELDKLVMLTIGKENIGLHNEIIKAIFTNAVKSETPPPKPLLVQDTSKPVKGVRRKPLLQYAILNDASKTSPTAGDAPVCWSNGVICGESPKKGRNKSIRKDKEMLSSTRSDETNCLIDTQRPSEHIQGAAEQSKVNIGDGSMHLCKRPRIIIPSSPDLGMSKSVGDPFSLYGVADARVGEAHGQWENELVRTPLGTPFNNMDSATKKLQFRLAGLSYLQLKDAEQDFDHSSNLPSVDLIQAQMERIAELEGLESVSEKCVEILNQGMDTFLKGLIGSCINFVKTRSLRHRGSQSERQGSSRPCNGGGTQKESMRGDLSRANISFLDFLAAMDANPQQLGDKWPLQLERLHLTPLTNIH